MEKRHNYVRKVAEVAAQLFISGDKPNVAGLILAGSADFKTELGQSDMFDQRLQAKIIKTVDVSYGGENGFNQAIELAAESLHNVKFIQEKKLIGRYFDEISQDTGKYCFGVEDTLKALELGAVEILICWENLDIQRYVLKNQGASTQTTVLHLTPEQEKDKSHFTDKEVRRGGREKKREFVLIGFCFPERRRNGTGRVAAAARVAGQQLQELRCYAGDYH